LKSPLCLLGSRLAASPVGACWSLAFILDGCRRTMTGGGSWTARRFLVEGKYADRGRGVADAHGKRSMQRMA